MKGNLEISKTIVKWRSIAVSLYVVCSGLPILYMLVSVFLCKNFNYELWQLYLHLRFH